MKKRVVRLTESEFHNLIKNSVKRVLNERKMLKEYSDTNLADNDNIDFEHVNDDAADRANASEKLKKVLNAIKTWCRENKLKPEIRLKKISDWLDMYFETGKGQLEDGTEIATVDFGIDDISYDDFKELQDLIYNYCDGIFALYPSGRHGNNYWIDYISIKVDAASIEQMKADDEHDEMMQDPEHYPSDWEEYDDEKEYDTDFAKY